MNLFKKISNEFFDLRLALSFFTILPLSPKKNIQEARWARSIKYLWLVGLVYGFVNLLFLKIFEILQSLYLISLDKLSSSLLLALSLVLIHVFLSGGLHIDAIMDSFDGLGASKKNFHECRKVMKDSRSGAFGVMSACVYFLSKLIFLFIIFYQSKISWIILGIIIIPIFSRSLMAASIRKSLFSKEKDLDECKLKESSTWVFFENAKQPADSILNFIFLLLIVFLLVNFLKFSVGDLKVILLIISSGLIFNLWLYKFLSNRLFGLSGDSLGAGLEITEVFLYFLLALV